jgi:hypothetical protein
MDRMKNASEKLIVVKGEAGESVSTKLQVVLKRNPGFFTFTSVCQVLNGDNVDPPEDIAPENTPLLKYPPVTSCFVEGSISTYKHILSDRKTISDPRKYGKDS